ncbi:MAG: FAD:protein FMN transferase [Nitrospirae bacterium]|nr:FAD:protein FMN transferase [Nitrospirota bacterium]
MLPSCTGKKPSVYRTTKPLMDTMVTITVVSDSKERAEKATADAFSAMERLGDLVSFFSENSELALINRNAGIRKVKVSSETLDVIEKAVSVSENSGGAFDPTIGPVMKLWDFHNNIRPADAELRQKLRLVDYRKILIDKNKSTVFLQEKGMLLDLGGIAKGYSADLAVDTLMKNGIHSGIVAAAGDIRTFGTKPDGKLWNIGIRNPRQKDTADELLAKVHLSDRAISTSGDYERFFIADGKRFHHLLDPRTGYPADACRSVSIISRRGVFSDAYSTAVFILGPEKGQQLISEMDMDAIIVDSSGKISATAGIREALKIEENN